MSRSHSRTLPCCCQKGWTKYVRQALCCCCQRSWGCLLARSKGRRPGEPHCRPGCGPPHQGLPTLHPGRSSCRCCCPCPLRPQGSKASSSIKAGRPHVLLPPLLMSPSQLPPAGTRGTSENKPCKPHVLLLPPLPPLQLLPPQAGLRGSSPNKPGRPHALLLPPLLLSSRSPPRAGRHGVASSMWVPQSVLPPALLLPPLSPPRAGLHGASSNMSVSPAVLLPPLSPPAQQLQLQLLPSPASIWARQPQALASMAATASRLLAPCVLHSSCSSSVASTLASAFRAEASQPGAAAPACSAALAAAVGGLAGSGDRHSGRHSCRHCSLRVRCTMRSVAAGMLVSMRRSTALAPNMRLASPASPAQAAASSGSSGASGTVSVRQASTRSWKRRSTCDAVIGVRHSDASDSVCRPWGQVHWERCTHSHCSAAQASPLPGTQLALE